MPQPVWWITRNSRVPSSSAETISERSASSEARLHAGVHAGEDRETPRRRPRQAPRVELRGVARVGGQQSLQLAHGDRFTLSGVCVSAAIGSAATLNSYPQ
jgi:hypothetical protein